MGKDQEAINFIINLTSSSIVNITFATELFLKCICVIENGFFYRTHKLEQLFQYISQENQDKIIMYHDEIINCNPLNKGLSKAFGSEFLDFKSMLKQSSNAFIEFRYKFGNSKFIPYNLNDASTAIRRLIIKTKHWPRLYLPH
jgi:hypothetical protein